jgi:hypothetical protein
MADFPTVQAMDRSTGNVLPANRLISARERQAQAGTHQTPPEAKPHIPLGTPGDLAKTAVAATLGLAGDLTEMGSPLASTLAGVYEGMKYDPFTRQAPQVIAEVREGDDPNVPFTTSWFQERFGANPNTVAAKVGEWLDPRGAAKKTIPIMFAGALGGEKLAASIGHFMGRNKRTIQENFDFARNNVAHESPQDLWLKTGWILDPVDGQWKYQINSWDSKIKHDKLYEMELEPFGSAHSMKLGDILDMPHVYNVYPQLMDIDLDIMPRKQGMENVLGYASNSQNKIAAFVDPFNNDVEELRDTLVHEVEHFIQVYENHGLGASNINFADPMTQDYFFNDLPKALENKMFENRVLEYMIKHNVRDEFGFRPEQDQLAVDFLTEYAKTTGIKLSELSNDKLEVLAKYGNASADWHQSVLRTGKIEERFMQEQYMTVEEALLRDNDMSLVSLLNDRFHRAYKNVLGEVNARLTSYDNALAKTPEGRARLQIDNPISRRMSMQFSEGLDPARTTLQDPARTARSQAIHYERLIRRKETMPNLLKSIEEQLYNAATEPK